MTSPLYNKFGKLSKSALTQEFVIDCEYGNLDAVKYLLTSPELQTHANLKYNNDVGFRFACYKGHLDIVKFLLTSSELLEKPNINAGHDNDDSGIYHACKEGYVEMVKYLLTSPDLQEHANIHENKDSIFRTICLDGNSQMIQYLIFDYNIEKTEYIDNFLKGNRLFEIDSMFEKRDLNNSLLKDLAPNLINKKKIKI